MASAGSSELETYTQLLRALLPRMTGVSIYNAAAEVIWSSEMVTDPSLARVVNESMRTACTEPGTPGVCIPDSEPMYIYWLWKPNTCAPTPPFATVLLRCKASSSGEQHTLKFVHSLVRPALEILTRELVSREQISNLSGSLAEQDQDLDMLLSVSGSDNSAEDGGGDELKAVLRAAVEHIQGGLAAIIVPEKGLVLVHRDPNHEIEASLVARAHRHLVSTAQLRSEAVIVNRMQLAGKEEGKSYRLLSCAVMRGDGRAIGVLALFRPEGMPEFTQRQARLAELLARRVAAVIPASYDALTGLLNRPAFEQRVQSTLKQQASVQRWWSALAIDTNRMHVINDSYGMHVGDKVIAQIGDLVRKRVPPGAIAARISGDRFAVLLPVGLDDAAHFRRIAAPGRRAARRIHRRRHAGRVDQHRRRRGRTARAGVHARFRRRRDGLQGRQRPRPQPRRGLPGSGREHRAPLHRHQRHHRPALGHRRGPAAAERAAAAADGPHAPASALRVAAAHDRRWTVRRWDRIISCRPRIATS